MNAKKIVLIGVGGWLLYKMLGVVQTGLALANFKVSPASFKIHKVTTKGVELRASLNIDNLSDQSLYLNAIMVQVAINGKYLGSKNIQIRSTVYPFYTKPLNLTFNIPYMSMLSLLWNYSQEKRSDYPINISLAGYVVANNQSFPFSNNFTVNIPGLPEIMQGIQSVSTGIKDYFTYDNLKTIITTPKDESSSTITQTGEPDKGNA